jgi:hypothetical protein
LHQEVGDSRPTLSAAKEYNQKLSERRAALGKRCLVPQGVPADLIEIRAEGKEQQLGGNCVEQLQVQDRVQPGKWNAPEICREVRPDCVLSALSDQKLSRSKKLDRYPALIHQRCVHR